MRTPIPAASGDTPLENFSHCHDGILKHLQSMEGLPALAETAQKARQQAESVLHFFRKVVLNHHEEEERLLFDAVLRSAIEGAEARRVQELIAQLTLEHRRIEAQFARLEPEIKKMAKGQSCQLDAPALRALVQQYRAHAEFEETAFLPLSHTILGRNSNHMAALGLSLHIRHVSIPSSPT